MSHIHLFLAGILWISAMDWAQNIYTLPTDHIVYKTDQPIEPILERKEHGSMFLYYISLSWQLAKEEFITMQFLVDSGCPLDCVLIYPAYTYFPTYKISRHNKVNIMGQGFIKKLGFNVQKNQISINKKYIPLKSD